MKDEEIKKRLTKKIMDRIEAHEHQVIAIWVTDTDTEIFICPEKPDNETATKIASLSQDVFRIMANSNREVTMGERVEMIDTFCTRLELSGYPPKIASRIVRNGLLCYEKKMYKAEAEKKMFQRP